jgi:hypothetical protein
MKTVESRVSVRIMSTTGRRYEGACQFPHTPSGGARLLGRCESNAVRAGAPVEPGSKPQVGGTTPAGGAYNSELGEHDRTKVSGGE